MKITITILARLLLIFTLSCALMSCATRADGTKTFAGLSAGQWGQVSLDASSAYLDQRYKREPVTSAKEAESVEPAKETSWLDVGLSLLGF
ncbi:hypothetical protein SAMN02745166_01487 [Prosthecobacter debontii]|uniref:Lipoprotein n=1 Tax=Prosthecobacter debontii TaxID=48467 RepID=A0A1T4XGR6_9BACT|nr:hypothetical protein [Prosthecobacter debontii]SKA88792.1 hypothetical protein SAMN02745166_01487 [Prosthecobacter debontii]